MGGDNSQTTTSGLNNAQLNSAVSSIGSGLNTAIGQGVKPFQQSLYPGLSSQTTQGVNALTNNASNAAYGDAIRGTINDFGAIASGQRFGMDDPGYAAMRQNALDDAMTSVGSSFLTDGRFGSSVMGDAAGEAATGVLAAMDYQNFQNDQQRQMQAAGMLPGLYQGSMMPAAAQLQAGQIMDADMLASRQGEADLFDRTQNAQWNTLARATGILAGTAPSAGQTTTQSQQTPWWQVPAQIGGTVLGAMF